MTNTALSLSDKNLKQLIGVKAGEVQKLTYTLNLESSGLKINSAAANTHESSGWAKTEGGEEDQPNGKQRLGTITFTFGAHAGIGHGTDDEVDGKTETALALRDTSTGQVFNLDDITKQAADISENGYDSVYYSLYYSYAHETRKYECVTTLENPGEVSDLTTSDRCWPVLVADVLHDSKVENPNSSFVSSEYAGITFCLGLQLPYSGGYYSATPSEATPYGYSNMSIYSDLSSTTNVWYAFSVRSLFSDDLLTNLVPVIKSSYEQPTGTATDPSLVLRSTLCDLFLPSLGECVSLASAGLCDDEGQIYPIFDKSANYECPSGDSSVLGYRISSLMWRDDGSQPFWSGSKAAYSTNVMVRSLYIMNYSEIPTSMLRSISAVFVNYVTAAGVIAAADRAIVPLFCL